MKKALLIALTLFLPLAMLLTGCGKKSANQDKDNNLTVYTTVYPLQYFTERIGGSLVNVNTIYPPGADEHTFEPSQRDMMKLIDADLFFYIGLGLEGFVEKSKSTLKNGNVKLVAVADGLNFERNANDEKEHDDESGDTHDHSLDPHVWLDPIYAQELAKTIKNELSKKMPEEKSTFEKNYQQLINDLQKLHQDFEKITQNSKHKQIIVAHAAYGYWEKRYGIKQISVSGLSTTNEPSQKKLEQIIADAEQENIKYIFFEQNVHSKITKVVQKEIGAKALTLHNLSVLTPDDIKQKETYFTIMENNLTALKKALNE